MATSQCWLVKSEPDCYSIDHLARDKKTSWSGVRNFQARNFMRDQMKVGDPVLFYHSSADPPAIVGVAKVCREAHPDPTAMDKKDDHFDPKSTKENPIWMMVDIAFVEKFPNPIPLGELRDAKNLAGLPLLKRGQRLSVMPVDPRHFEVICKLGRSR